MAETCSTCRFWKAYPRSDGAPPMAGLCRALPPNMAGMWPDTRAVDWCGVYAAPVSSVVAVAPVASTMGAARDGGAEAVPVAPVALDAAGLARRLRAEGLTLRAVGERLAAAGVVSTSGGPLAPASVSRLMGAA